MRNVNTNRLVKHYMFYDRRNDCNNMYFVNKKNETPRLEVSNSLDYFNAGNWCDSFNIAFSSCDMVRNLLRAST